jgi:hypothetical protein
MFFEKVTVHSPTVQLCKIYNQYFFQLHFAGSTVSKTLRIFEQIHIKVISKSTVFRHARNYIQPCIIEKWKLHQGELVALLNKKGGKLILAGDSRCDSPGHCAKYGSYTVIEQRIRKLLDVQLVQVRIIYF